MLGSSWSLSTYTGNPALRLLVGAVVKCGPPPSGSPFTANPLQIGTSDETIFVESLGSGVMIVVVGPRSRLAALILSRSWCAMISVGAVDCGRSGWNVSVPAGLLSSSTLTTKAWPFDAVMIANVPSSVVGPAFRVSWPSMLRIGGDLTNATEVGTPS